MSGRRFSTRSIFRGAKSLSAICLYLADRHPEARLSPPPHTPEWSRYFESLIHLTNTVQPALMAYHYPEEQTIDGRGSREIRARAEAKVVEAFRYLNETVAD